MTRALRGGMAALVAGLLVASVATVGVAPAAASAGQFISITSTTTPNQPTTNGEFTFTMSFTSAEGSDGSATIERIEVHDVSGGDETLVASKTYPVGGSPAIGPGETVDQALSLSFDDPGTRELRVDVTFDTGSRLVRTSYRTNLTVYRPNPGIQVDADPTTAGERTDVTVDVANGREDTVRDVELSLAADDVAFDDQSRVASSIPGGETSTFTFSATPETLGSKPVDVTLSYTTADGTRRSITRSVDVAFRTPEFAGDIGVAAQVAPAIPGADTTLNLTLSNGLDRAIRQMEVTVTADGATVTQNRRITTGFESGTQRTFRFSVSRETAGRQPVEVAISFTTADGIEGAVTETLSTTFDEPTNPGEIRLTGTSATRRGGEVEISATASNVGSGDVSAVIVAVGDDAAVAPADYFVGDIEGGDFASFTLTTTSKGNLTTVPVTVSYVVDGVEQTVTTDVAVEGGTVQPQSGGSGGGGGLVILVGLVLLVLVGGAALVYRRRG